MNVNEPNFVWYEIMSRSLIPRQLVKANMISSLLPTRPVDVHLSIWRYGDEALRYSKEIIPNIKKSGSIKKFKGPYMSDGLWIDIDTPDGELDTSLVILVKLRDFLHEHFGIGNKNYVTYFSGRKGFHLYIPFSIFTGSDFYLPPSKDFSSACYDLFVLLLEDSGLIQKEDGIWIGHGFDMGIYSPLHMIRFPGSIHPATQFWKNPLSEEDVDGGLERIFKSCSERAPKIFPEEMVSAETLKIGKEIYDRIKSGEYENRKSYTKIDPANLFSLSSLENMNLPGYGPYLQREQRTIKALLGPVKASSGIGEWPGRNAVLAHLCGVFANKKMSKEISTAILYLWNEQSCEPPMPEDELRDTINSFFGS